MPSVRAFTALSRGERRLTARAAWMLMGARLRLRFWGVADALRRLPDPQVEERGGRDSSATAVKVQGAVSRARRAMGWGESCLVEALAVCRMLRNMGIPAHVRFAVRKADDAPGIRAHAWVEIESTGEGINRDPAYEDFEEPG